MYASVALLPRPAQSDGGSSGASGDQAAQQAAGLSAGDWIQAGIIVGAAIVLAIGAAWLVRRAVRRRNQMLASLAGRTAATIIFVVGLVYGLNSVGVRIGPLLGGLGIGGLAVAFALKSILHDLFAGILIQLRQPFQIGDLVKLDGYFGRVKQITLRTVDIKTVSGEYVMLPAGSVVSNPIENWTRLGKRRADVIVGIGYEADPDEVAKGIAAAVSSLPCVLDEEVKVVVSELGASSVDLRVLAWHDIDDHFLDVRHAVADAAKRWCDDNGVSMPSPIREVQFTNTGELAEALNRAGVGAGSPAA